MDKKVQLRRRRDVEDKTLGTGERLFLEKRLLGQMSR
jgi:hypothetical protein